MPLIVTEGFRRRVTMEGAVEQNEADVVGLARPLCIEPNLPERLLKGEVEAGPTYEEELRLGPWIVSPDSPFETIRKSTRWGKRPGGLQVMRMGQAEDPDPQMSVLKALFKY